MWGSVTARWRVVSPRAVPKVSTSAMSTGRRERSLIVPSSKPMKRSVCAASWLYASINSESP